MTIVRNPNRPVMVEREVLLDASLGFAARGVYAYLVAREEEECPLEDILYASPDGFGTIHDAINELLSKGYISQDEEEQS